MAEQTEQFIATRAAAFPPPGTAMTSAEFEALPETAAKVELIDGMICYPEGAAVVDGEVVPMPPELDHQDCSMNFIALLLRLIPNGRLYHAPTQLDFGDTYKPEPDIMWVSASGTAQRGRLGILGAPDLIVEILSPATRRHDQVTKFALYEQHGVREYWVADLTEQSVRVWVNEGTRFQNGGLFFDGDTFASPVIGRDVTLTGIFNWHRTE